MPEYCVTFFDRPDSSFYRVLPPHYQYFEVLCLHSGKSIRFLFFLGGYIYT